MERFRGRYCKIVTKEPGEERANVVTGILEDVDYEDGFILVNSEQGLGCLRISTIIAIKPGKHRPEYKKIKKDMKHKLSHLGDYYDISEVKIYDPLEVYTGDKIPELPDLLFTLDNFECSVSHEFSPVILENVPDTINRSGNHKIDGIIMGVGPDIKKGKIGSVKIFDIAPSILYYFNESIPRDIDGKALKRIFKDKFHENRKIKFTDPIESEEKIELKERDDLNEVEERLKNLGYL